MAKVVFGPRARLLAGLVAASAGLLATSCASQPPAGTLARPRPCATSALRVGFGRQLGVAAGHVDRGVVFTNRSGITCTLDGYPAVSFVTAPGGRQVGAAAGRIPGRQFLVVLAPGARAGAALLLIDMLNFGPPPCPMSPAYGLRIYPPGQRAARYIGMPGRVCSGPRPVVMFVGPVRQAGS